MTKRKIPIDVVVQIRKVEELPGSYRVERTETGDVLYLTKKWYVKFFPGRVIIPAWYAKKLGIADAKKS